MAKDTQKAQDAIEVQTALPGFPEIEEKMSDLADMVKDINEKIEAKKDEINRMWPDLDEYADQLSNRDAFIDLARHLKPSSILDTFTEEESAEIIKALEMAAEIEKSAENLLDDEKAAKLEEAKQAYFAILEPLPLGDVIKLLRITNRRSAAAKKGHQRRAATNDSDAPQQPIKALAFPTADSLLGALTANQLYLMPRDGSGKLLQLADDTGEISKGAIRRATGNQDELQRAPESPFVFMGYLMGGLLDRYKNGDPNAIKGKLIINTRQFFKDTEANPRRKEPATDKDNSLTEQKRDIAEDRFATLYQTFKPLEEYAGKLPDGSIFRVAIYEGYEATTENMVISLPYFLKIIEANVKDQYTRFARPSLWAERNTTAAEVVVRLLQGLQKRGLTKDSKVYRNKSNREPDEITVTTDSKGKTATTKKYTRSPAGNLVTYEISLKGVIDDCPQLSAELEAIESRTIQNEDGNIVKDPARHKAYNLKLKQTFERAYSLLFVKTSIFDYYDQLEINFPQKFTKKALDQKIIITHTGSKSEKEKRTRADKERKTAELPN